MATYRRVQETLQKRIQLSDFIKIKRCLLILTRQIIHVIICRVNKILTMNMSSSFSDNRY